MRECRIRLVLWMISLLYFINASAQNNILRGIVRYQNSNFRKAVGVIVKPHPLSGDQANQAFSDDNGVYQLVYNNRKSGDPVSVFVGDLTKNNESIEIVNNRELEAWSVPSNPGMRSFDIVVCKKGERDRAARQYYKILKSAAEEQIVQKQKELAVLKEQFNNSNEVILEQEQEIKLLKQQADSIKLYREALDIASINKDGASSRVLKYLALLESGNSITEARKALSVEKAFTEGKASLAQLQSSINEIESSIALSLKLWDNTRAVQQVDTLLLLLDQPLVDKSIFISRLLDASRMCVQLRDKNKSFLDKGIVYVKRAQQVQADNFSEHWKPTTNLLMGELLMLSKKFEEAEENFKEAIAIAKRLAIGDPVKWIPYVGMGESSMGTSYFNQKKYEEAKDCYLRSVDILRRSMKADDDENYKYLFFSLEQLAICEHKELAFYKADSLYNETLVVAEKMVENKLMWISSAAELWKRYAVFLEEYQQLEKAEAAYRKAINIFDALPQKKWLELVNTKEDFITDLLNFYKRTYNYRGIDREYLNYINLYKKAATMDSSYNGYVSYAYKGMGDYYRSNGELAKARECYNIATKEVKGGFSVYSPTNIYDALGELSEIDNDIPAAIKNYTRAVYEVFKKFDNSKYSIFLGSQNLETLVHLLLSNKMYDSAWKIFNDLDDRYHVLYKDNNNYYSYRTHKEDWAKYYHYAGLHDKANEIYAQMLEIAYEHDKKDTIHFYGALLQKNWAEHYLLDRDFDNALKCYNKYEQFVISVKPRFKSVNYYNKLLAECKVLYADVAWQQLIATGDLQCIHVVRQYLKESDSLITLAKGDSLMAGSLSKVGDQLKKTLDSITAENVGGFQYAYRVDSLKKSIDNISSEREKVGLYRQLITSFQKMTGYFPSYPGAVAELARLYGNLSWALLFDRKYREAEQAAREGLKTDAKQVWIQTNLAHSLLLQGRNKEAMSVYLQYKDVYYNGHLFKDAFINDINELKQKGITNNQFEFISQLLAGQRNKAELDFYNQLITGAILQRQEASLEPWIYRQAGDVFFGQKMYDSAVAKYSSALEAQRALEDSLNDPGLWLINARLGCYYRAIGKYDMALYFQKRAVRELTPLLQKGDPGLLSSINDIMLLTINTEGKKAAYQYYDIILNNKLSDALASRKKIKESLTDLAKLEMANEESYYHLYDDRSKYKGLLTLFHSNANSWMKLPDSLRTGLGETMHLRAFVYYTLGNYREALLFGKMAVDFYERKREDFASLAWVYNNLAVIYDALNDKKQKTIYEEKAKACFEKISKARPVNFDKLHFDLQQGLFKNLGVQPAIISTGK